MEELELEGIVAAESSMHLLSVLKAVNAIIGVAHAHFVW
jgi:hypothetical protein